MDPPKLGRGRARAMPPTPRPILAANPLVVLGGKKTEDKDYVPGQRVSRVAIPQVIPKKSIENFPAEDTSFEGRKLGSLQPHSYFTGIQQPIQEPVEKTDAHDSDHIDEEAALKTIQGCLDIMGEKGYIPTLVETFRMTTKKVCKTTAVLNKVMLQLYEFSLKSLDNSSLGSRIFAQVRHIEANNVTLGNLMLNKLQYDYEDFRKQNYESDTNLKKKLLIHSCLLLNIFANVRLLDGKYLSFLVKPAYEVLESLLSDDCEEESIKIFSEKLALIANDLQTEDPESYSDLFKKLREKLINSSHSSVHTRALLVMTFERSLKNWSLSDDE